MNKPWSPHERSLKEILQDWVRSPGIRKQYLRVLLKETWTKEMGDLVVKYTKKLSVRKGVLTVFVSSAPLKQEILLNKTKILKMMNDGLGEELLTDLKVK